MTNRRADPKSVTRLDSCGVLPICTGYFYSKGNHYIKREKRISGRGRYVLPYISHIGTYVPPHRVGFLGPFGLKTGIHFVHFGLETGMFFKGTRESMNVFIVSIPNE